MRSAYMLLALALGASAQNVGQQSEQPNGAVGQPQQPQDPQQQKQEQQPQQANGQTTNSTTTAGGAQGTPSGATPPASGNPNAPPAEVSQNNPLGNVFKAEMPSENKSGIKGYVSGTANTNGTGVVWSVNIENLPKTNGPFAYHVHEKPLSADGDCQSAGAHLDPQGRGEDPPCDLKQGSKSCQVGDLSGKHGKMTESPWQKFYLDLYTSTSPGTPGYVGGRSIVIHDKDKNRLTCANLTMVAYASQPGSCDGSQGGQGGSSQGTQGGSQGGGSSSSGTTQSTPSESAKQAAATASGPPLTGGAARNVAAPATVALGLTALVAALL